MINLENNTITVEVLVQAPLQKVWDCWTTPEDICNWNFASDTWHNPRATNNLVVGGSFVYHMAAKDGSFAFDFNGEYEQIVPQSLIVYHIEGGRKVTVHFSSEPDGIRVLETFEPEEVNSLDLQESGWQAILNNFKKYTEANA